MSGHGSACRHGRGAEAREARGGARGASVGVQGLARDSPDANLMDRAEAYSHERTAAAVGLSHHHSKET